MTGRDADANEMDILLHMLDTYQGQVQVCQTSCAPTAAACIFSVQLLCSHYFVRMKYFADVPRIVALRHALKWSQWHH